MSEPALVVLDQGTSSTRAAVYRAGRLAREARRQVGIHFPGPGRAEQDARELAEASSAALEEACSELREGEPAILGITNQRSTVVLWDSETGRPLGPALTWRDSRAQAEAEALRLADSDLAVRTGLPSSPHYGAPKIVWALQHWPEARAAANADRLRVGPVSTWLLFKLTRGASFTVDPTNAQRMHLLDLADLQWHDALVEACSLPASSLPVILPTDGLFGEVRVGDHVLPVRAMLGDQQAALIGLREASDEPVTGVHLGTGGFVLRDVGADCRFVPGLLSGIARADANRTRRYLVEGPVNSAGSALDRLRDVGLLAPDEDVDALCRKAERPAIVVPAWGGLAAPWWSASAEGAVVGWSESGTREDLVAGTVRGIAFLVADVVDRLREHDLPVDRLQASGPLAGLECLVQALADATGAPVHVRANPEASLEGLATALAEACGATAPVLSVVEGSEALPRPEALAEDRRLFRRAREAALDVARARP